MSWKTLSAVLDHSGVPDKYHLSFGHQRYDEMIWDVFSKVQVIEHQRESSNLTTPLNSSLLDVLSRFRATSSTDPRDKIYGLLGLASDTQRIIPDYRKSVQQVYAEAAEMEINSSKNLDVITQSLWPLGSAVAQDSKSRHRLNSYHDSLVQNLPSRVPNFSCTVPKQIMFAQRSIFSSGRTECKTPANINANGELTISGIVIGCVKLLKPLTGSHRDGLHFCRRVRDWLPSDISNDITSGNYPTGGTLLEGYWRTLLTDCTSTPINRFQDSDIDSFSHLVTSWIGDLTKLPSDALESWTTATEQDQRLFVTFRLGDIVRIRELSDLHDEWRFAELEDGLYAMVPWTRQLKEDIKGTTQVGDVIVAADGGKVPLVLRRKPALVGEQESWVVIGTSYVHGMMDGLAEDWVKRGLLERRDFQLA